MRLIAVTLLLSLFGGSVFAQLPPGTPACAVPCLVQSIASSACSITNTTCLCADAAFATNVADCAQANCIVEDVLSELFTLSIPFARSY